jgi:hypothetical protein
VKPLSLIPRIPHLIELALGVGGAIFYGTGGVYLGSAKRDGKIVLLFGPRGELIATTTDAAADKVDIVGNAAWAGGNGAYIGTVSRTDTGYGVYGADGRFLGSVNVDGAGARSYYNALGRFLGVGIKNGGKYDFSDSRGAYVGTAQLDPA